MSSKHIGYIRVSTDKQNLETQKHTILEYAFKNKITITNFVEIEISSKKSIQARKIDQLFNSLSSGDTLLITELSRLGRNMLEILNLIDQFKEKEIKIIFINQLELSTNSDNALSQLMYSIYGYFAQTEREIISERTKQGLAKIKAQGKILGKPKGSKSIKPLDQYRVTIIEYINFGLNYTAILKLLNPILNKPSSLNNVRYFIQTDTKLNSLYQKYHKK